MKVGFSFEFGKRVVHYDVEFHGDLSERLSSLNEGDFNYVHLHLDDLVKSSCDVFARVFAELDETIREVNDDL